MSTTTAAEPQYKVLIGMEIHVQLATQSKMFTGAANGFGGDPNSQVDPVILGLPGVLPVINKRAVEMAMMVGLALNCQIAAQTKWDRKSYYYPDLPKNYQISQYDQPLCGAGSIELPLADGGSKTVRIRRAHLEEDAGKLLHEAGMTESLVDLNRAGTPLLEIVTEPDLTSPEEARLFGEELRRICRYLGVSHGIMQQGHMRFEPNINLHIYHHGKTIKTAITEIKNLNSFRAVERACSYEIQRQLAEYLAHPEVMPSQGKSTRGWDDDKGMTLLQREKEEAHDYRYFPDPDLVPLHIAPRWVEAIRSGVVELPIARRKRYQEVFGMSAKEAFSLTEERAVADLFDRAASLGAPVRRLTNLFLGPAAKMANEAATDQATTVLISDLPVTAEQYARLAQLVETGGISATSAVMVFEHLIKHPEADPAQAAEQLGLMQIRDQNQTEAWVMQALAANPQAISDYKNNPKKKQASLGFLRGAVMKASQGKADPKLVGEILEAKLKA
ncbi:MAG: Asp-tRNA(Asn)/Glu-tRNA(Gln) amidotransferase subunit GatB [Planctomycetes bacterium]|jgi:aspartyl-tRNA(Asn)/glutamyl-tRNA(Gln) amidotransferase subunit B|nr:Asp-tRNA(Asn)/Glu-tRNA(Gln) amidotransferase subunit GatB [Planctomycetota bacterium]